MVAPCEKPAAVSILTSAQGPTPLPTPSPTPRPTMTSDRLFDMLIINLGPDFQERPPILMGAEWLPGRQPSVLIMLVKAARVSASWAFFEHRDTVRAITAAHSHRSARLFVGSMLGSSRSVTRCPGRLCRSTSAA